MAIRNENERYMISEISERIDDLRYQAKRYAGHPVMHTRVASLLSEIEELELQVEERKQLPFRWR